MIPGSSAAAVAEIRRRAEAVRDRIVAAGGDPGAITLVAVTKAFGPEVLRDALAAGLPDVGENYAQELLDKAAALGGPEALREAGARVHFVGRLQRNKVRALAPLVDLWQSVDRLEVGAEIAKRAPGAAVLVQVNATAEPQKGGCEPAAVAALVDGLGAHGLDVRGLMTVGRAGDPEATRRAFDLVADLAIDLDLPVRSMGMSGDLEVAVAAGATMVRIGTDLFGSRPPRPARMPVEEEKRLQ